jgi:hypothetical protein
MEKWKVLTRRLTYRGSRSSLIIKEGHIDPEYFHLQLMGYPPMTWVLIA